MTKFSSHIFKSILRLISLSMSIITPPVVPPPFNAYSLTTVKYGPFGEYQNDAPITFTLLTKNDEEEVNVRIAVEDLSDGRMTYVGRGDIQTQKNIARTFTLDLPTNRFLGPKGMRTRFDVIIYEADTVLSMNLIIYPLKDSDTINPFNYRNEIYNRGGTTFALKGTYIQFSNETYDFSNLQDFFMMDSYYQLVLSSICFDMTYEEKLTYSEAYIELRNPQKCFSLLVDKDNKCRIKIGLEKDENNRVSLIFTDFLYVDPTTLIMSLYPKAGFIQTKNFYFPYNKMDDVSKQEFIIVITELGYSDLTLTWPMFYDASKGFVGTCQNSKYCVIGDITK